jgi:toxin FitB
MYLLDTNVLSERRKPRPPGALVVWVDSIHPDNLFISAMTIAEVQAGVERTRDNDTLRAAEIESWLAKVILTSQILPMGTEVAREWARMMHKKPEALASDAWIAATAKHFQKIVATRNVRDFQGFGVEVFNPFADTRPAASS